MYEKNIKKWEILGDFETLWTAAAADLSQDE